MIESAATTPASTAFPAFPAAPVSPSPEWSQAGLRQWLMYAGVGCVAGAVIAVPLVSAAFSESDALRRPASE